MINKSELKEIFDRARILNAEYKESKYIGLMQDCENLMDEDFPLSGINLLNIIMNIFFFNPDATDKELFDVILTCNIEFEEE